MVAKRVLLVEDHAFVATVSLEALKILGYDTAHAQTGMEVLPLIDTFQPDVVLLDLGLPDISGIHVLSMIRAEKKNVFVVGLTNQELNETQWRNAGFDNFFLKPMDFSVLNNLLEERCDSTNKISTLNM